jgi:hypothetical protein
MIAREVGRTPILGSRVLVNNAGKQQAVDSILDLCRGLENQDQFIYACAEPRRAIRTGRPFMKGLSTRHGRPIGSLL